MGAIAATGCRFGNRLGRALGHQRCQGFVVRLAAGALEQARQLIFDALEAFGAKHGDRRRSLAGHRVAGAFGDQRRNCFHIRGSIWRGIELGEMIQLDTGIIHALHQLLELTFHDAGVGRHNPLGQRFNAVFDAGKAWLHARDDGMMQRRNILLQPDDVAIAGFKRADLGRQILNTLHQHGRNRIAVADRAGERRHLGGQALKITRGQRHVAFDGVDTIINIAHIGFDGVHRRQQCIGQWRLSAPTMLARDFALHLLRLQFGQLAYGGGNIVKATIDRGQIHAGRLCNQRRQRSDLRFQPLDLPGFTHRACQQFDHMGQLLDLARHFADAAIGVALGLEFTFKPFEPSGQAVDQCIELTKLRHLGRASACSGGRRRKLPPPNLGDGAGEGIDVISLEVIVALGKPIDRPLHRAQRLAAAHGRLGPNHLITEIANALAETVKCRFRPFDARIAPLDLIEQGHQFTAQSVPFALPGVVGRIGHFLGRIGSGHVGTCVDGAPPRFNTKV